ncbi:hypothetical protein FB561_1315 [Kribbella amoyensis]|uniref:Uncharacterized protein n=1 Tax=Kribbella amoyensis TaxID=996641 RepID=A0A561BN63_9ACTN|nr:hypothetical protein [Kribbella amoyensis]TWD80242.1 hypothetical protein FB561_1315 [Kribbella amoyensis]
MRVLSGVAAAAILALGVAVQPASHAVQTAPAAAESVTGSQAATVWKYRHNCGLSYDNCAEDRRLYSRLGWPVSAIYYTSGTGTCPGGGCPKGYYFYYGNG